MNPSVKKVITLTKKLKAKFVGKNPTEIYAILQGDEIYRTIISYLTPHEYVILIFLLSNDNESIDLESFYGVISFNLFTFQTALVLEDDPYVDCDRCGGTGDYDCSECDGYGEIVCDECGGDGKVECSNCGGSGEINDEGETCDVCGGSGHVPCDHCQDGYNSCQYCGGSTKETCNDCDGSGEVQKPFNQKIEIRDYISYDKNFKERYEEETSIALNSDLDGKFYTSNMYLIIGEKEEINDDFLDDFNNDDFLLIETAKDNFRKNDFGKLTANDLPY